MDFFFFTVVPKTPWYSRSVLVFASCVAHCIVFFVSRLLYFPYLAAYLVAACYGVAWTLGHVAILCCLAMFWFSGMMVQVGPGRRVLPPRSPCVALRLGLFVWLLFFFEFCVILLVFLDGQQRTHSCVRRAFFFISTTDLNSRQKYRTVQACNEHQNTHAHTHTPGKCISSWESWQWESISARLCVRAGSSC